MYIKFKKESHSFFFGDVYAATMVDKYGELVDAEGHRTITSTPYKLPNDVKNKLYDYLHGRSYNVYVKDHFIRDEVLHVRVRTKADKATFSVLNVGVIEIERNTEELPVLKI